MEDDVTEIIAHMARSHVEMARMLGAKRQSIRQVSHIVTALPNETVQFGETDTIADNSVDLTKSVSAYLEALADLVDAIGDHLELVIKEMADSGDE